MLAEMWELFIQRSDFFGRLLLEHIEISLAAIVIAILFGGFVGILIAEYDHVAKPTLSVINFLYTIPSISMLGFLVIWLLVGIFFVPTFMKKTKDVMNDESLTLLSVGFCFAMALLANFLGFSMELGAFVAGSLFAGTLQARDVERVTMGIKDMFGAIFFLSVGMMVDPEVIATKWTSIVPIAIVAVVAKLIFSIIGMTLSGQDLDTSVRAGAALAPIGEFSFIIASLGISLGVMDDYLYPVIVSASILTIIVTPEMIKRSDHTVALFERIIPNKWQERIDNYTSDDQTEEEQTSDWRYVLRKYNLKAVIYGSIMLVTDVVGCRLIYPALAEEIGAKASAFACTTVIYLVIAVFAVPFMGGRSSAFTKLWMDRMSNRPPLMALALLKVAALVVMVLIPLVDLYNVRNWVVLLILPIALFGVARLDFVKTYYLQIETRFLANLNQKTMAERGETRKEQHWLDEDYSIFSFIVPKGAPYVGKSLDDLSWGRFGSVYVVKIRRGDKSQTMPSGRVTLKAGDKVHVIGEKKNLDMFYKTYCADQEINMRTLKDFLDGSYPDSEHSLACAVIHVRGTEPYVGKPIRKSGINSHNQCLILGLERGGYAIMMPDADMLIAKDDILWIIGTNDTLGRLAAYSVGKAGTHLEGGDNK